MSKDSVVTLTSMTRLDKSELDAPVGQVPAHLMAEVSQGARLVLGLGG